MATEPVISVRGEAVLEVEPEIAIVWVSVLARDKDRQRAVKLLADRNSRVTAEIKDGRARERITGYLAQANLTATVRNFDVLGDLVVGLADREMVTVTGPT